MNILHTVAIAATLLTAGGCASAFSGTDRATRPADTDTVVEVHNNNWSDMTIYVVRSGMRMRLGTVVSMNRESFVVPTGMINASGEVRLIADPIGGSPQYVTQPIMVNPGQQIEFTLENNLNLSSFSVW